MKKNKKLGKGLDAIFGENFQYALSEIEEINLTSKVNKSENIIEVDLNQIIPNPRNPRKTFNEESIDELSQSIKESGLLSPIILKKTLNNKYYIVAGERRYRATKKLGVKSIKSIVIDVDDQKLNELAIIENLQREDLNPIEEALGFQHLLNAYNVTHEELSKKLGKTRTYISNQLRLLNLDNKIIDYVIESKLTYGQVRPLITLSTEKAVKIAKQAIENNWTVREIESYIKNSEKKTILNSNMKSNKYEYAESLLRNKLDSKVEIKQGKVIIKFNDDSHLNRILKKLDLIEK